MVDVTVPTSFGSATDEGGVIEIGDRALRRFYQESAGMRVGEGSRVHQR